MAMRPRGGGASSSRLGRTTTVRPVYETFQPVFERQKEEEAEKLLIYLPGFSKENIRVSTEGKTTLKVRGERLIAANKWNRFLEEFQAPEECNMGGIHARFENGILTVTMPITKKTPPPSTAETQKPPPVKSSEQVDNFPPKISQPKPLKGDQDDGDFPTKTVGSRIESQKQLATPVKGDDDKDEDSQKETTPPEAADGVHSFERQKKPMFIKDYEDESPPKAAASVLSGGEKQGVQKSLADNQEKGQKMMKPLIGLKASFVEGEKSSEVKAKGTTTQTLDGRNKTTSEEKERRTGIGKDEQSNKQSSKISAADLKEERQLLVNAGVAVLVILALGAHIYNTLGTRKSD